MGVCTTILRRPDYASQFCCIGPACEDTCCVGWTVEFDKAICDKYQALPPSPLRDLILNNLKPLPLNPDGSTPYKFAAIQLTAEHACPLLGDDKLCQIQVTHGEAYLSSICAIYPRIKHCISGLDEISLYLSCPEAARLVLLSPDLLAVPASGHYQMSWDAAALQSEPLQTWFWPLREFILTLLTNRTYPLWQRLFLLGTFIRRIEAVDRGELKRNLFVLIKEFSAAIASGSLRASMETLPADFNLQLNMVLGLARLRLGRSRIGPRLVETFNTFTQGLGYGADLPVQTPVEHYRQAYRDFYAPFFAAHPYMLENLLANTIFRTLFPFGLEGAQPQPSHQLSREFARLATQFTLIKGLLIGVAGFHKEGFSAEHVVKTVQAVSKHFEHHPDFLDSAHALLVGSHLDNPRGLTLLLRN